MVAAAPDARVQTESFRTLYSFTKSNDGTYPYRGLMQAKDGDFYGTAGSFGAKSAGVVYRVSLDGTQKTLYRFSTPDTNGINTDGAYPYDAVVQATHGNLYGTCNAGAANGGGTIFRMSPTGAFSTLHVFTARDATTSTNVDGAFPGYSLVQVPNGPLYGTAYAGGQYATGTVYKITTAARLRRSVISDRSATVEITRGPIPTMGC